MSSLSKNKCNSITLMAMAKVCCEQDLVFVDILREIWGECSVMKH